MHQKKNEQKVKTVLLIYSNYEDQMLISLFSNFFTTHKFFLSQTKLYTSFPRSLTTNWGLNTPCLYLCSGVLVALDSS